MKAIVYDIFWIITFSISLAVNFHLFSTLLKEKLNGRRPQSGRCRVTNPTPDRRPVERAVLDLDGLPRFTGALSHVILEINDDELEDGSAKEKIEKMFAYWVKYPPCLLSSHPTSWSFTQLTLTMLLKYPPTSIKMAELRGLFTSLPVAVKACFHSFDIRHAGMERPQQQLQKSLNETLQLARDEDRKLFAALISNRIKLEHPNHALYINTDCIPIQENWANLVDYRTRAPNEPYWMNGSIFRGNRGQAPKNLASFLHVSRYSIYNLADPDFRDWYLRKVKPYVKENPVPLYEFGRWEMDIFHFVADLAVTVDFQTTSAKFRYSDLILNQWNMTIDVGKLIEEDPDIAFVCGIVPPLMRTIPQ